MLYHGLSRMALLLQRDSTRLFPKLLRMFQNAFSARRIDIQLSDVPHALTVVNGKYYPKPYKLCELNT